MICETIAVWVCLEFSEGLLKVFIQLPDKRCIFRNVRANETSMVPFKTVCSAFTCTDWCSYCILSILYKTVGQNIRKTSHHQLIHGIIIHYYSV